MESSFLPLLTEERWLRVFATVLQSKNPGFDVVSYDVTAKEKVAVLLQKISKKRSVFLLKIVI